MKLISMRSSFFMRLKLWVLLAGAALSRLTAQPVENAVFTLGTAVTDAQHRTWGYLALQPTDPELLKSRQFSIFSKTGDASSATAYGKQSVIGLQTEPATIQAILNRSAAVGDNLFDLEHRINNLFAAVMPSTNLTLAEKLSIVIQGTIAEPQNFGNLVLLGRLHPSVNLCLGLGHLQLLTNGPLTTFEVRLYDPVARTDGSVVGRVTLTNSAPLVLPAPGLPALVPEKGAMGNLNVRLRWATSPEFRRVALLSAGFDIFRVPEAVAIASGYTVHPPTIDQILGNPSTVRVNTQPVFKTRDYDSDVSAADLLSDPKTFFLADDNGLSRVTPPAKPMPFHNGDKFYYYIAARDLLGRNGVLSPGLQVTVCDRVPTDAPHLPAVDNFYEYAGGVEVQQLRVTWKPVTNAPDDKNVTGYYVYRWDSPIQSQVLGGNPLAHQVSAKIPHVPGQASYQFIDNGLGAPSAPADFGTTFWYTVRAIDDGACDGGNYSPSSAAAFGVLRDRNGPGAPTGGTVVQCCLPAVLGEKYNIYKPTSGSLDPELVYFEVTCHRTDPRVEWAEFTLARIGIETNFLGRYHFAANEDQVTRRVAFGRTGFTAARGVAAMCRVGTTEGLVSSEASDFTEQSPTPGLVSRLPFVGLVNCTPQTLDGATATGQFPCRSHSPQVPQPDGSVTNQGIDIILQLTPGTKEYKLYRRVDFGLLSLISQGDGDYDAATNALHKIQVHDQNLPANSSTICYYAQLFDENGNASPLAQIGSCFDVQMPMAIPLLAPLAPLGDSGSPQVDIRWFCPAVGVQRFLVEVAVENGFPPSVLGAPLGGDQVVHPNLVPIGPGPGSTNVADFAVYPTPGPGLDFGPGPAFEVVVPIQMGVTYTVRIQGVDKGGAVGPASHIETFTWTPPPTATGPHVPWPTRGLGAVGGLPPKVTAQRLTNGFYAGIGIQIGEVHRQQADFSDGFKAPRVGLKDGVKVSDLIYTNNAGKSLLPFVTYRYQVPNAIYPKPAGDLIQVSPRMDTLAVAESVNQSQVNYQKLVDPFVVAPPSAILGDTDVGVIPIYLLDTQPVVQNASYAYLLVRFGSNGEPVEVLPVPAVLVQP